MEQFDISEDIPTLLDDPWGQGQDRDTSQDKAGEGPQVRLMGYRWIASRGKEACPKCAALHNKVFYKNPKPGQASIDDMPKGQLHPNCGCTTEPVIGHNLGEVIVETHHPTIKPYMRGKVVRVTPPGFLFRIKPLNPIPIYGKN